MPTQDPLVSTDWLETRLAAPDVKVADATWFLPTVRRDARAEYAAAHLPGAVFFDIDDIADEASPLPHMLPDAVKFSSRMRRLGLGDGTRIVLYDNNHYSASARAWWMLRLFGHPDVVVLDGGLAKWRAEGRPLTDEPVTPREAHFTARQNNLLVRDLEQMRANVLSRREQVLDARSRGRFAGTEPEPRAGLRGGHIPSSVSLPHLELLGADGTLLPEARCAAASPPPESIWAGRSRPAAARASPRARSRSPCIASVATTSPSMTARGASGAGAATRRSRREQR
jgi:thiosulfate/3-mercaptopyruvate sulfurtransferase